MNPLAWLDEQLRHTRKARLNMHDIEQTRVSYMRDPGPVDAVRLYDLCNAQAAHLRASWWARTTSGLPAAEVWSREAELWRARLSEWIRVENFSQWPARQRNEMLELLDHVHGLTYGD